MQEGEPNRYNRREALVLGGSAFAWLAVGCSSEGSSQMEAIPIENAITPIRREAGIFTDQDIEDLANSMLSETEFNDIAYVGSILLKNVKGEPSFSTMTELFSDSTLEISIEDLSAKSGTAYTQISTERDSIKMDKIVIDKKLADESSEFLLKFIFAKELLSPLATDNVTTFIMHMVGENMSQDPNIDNPRKILALATVAGDGLPASFLADTVGHALLVPNFLKAIENNKFTDKDLDSGMLSLFDLISAICIGEGILEKIDGEYAWTGGYEETYLIWENIAAIWFFATNDSQSLELDEEAFKMAYDRIKTNETDVSLSLI